MSYRTKSRNVRLISAAVIAVLAAAATACAAPAPGPSAPSAPPATRVAHVSPAVAAQLATVTAIPFSDSDVTSVPAALLTRHAGRLLTAGGKPEILYVGSQYCPYCATENWALLVALGRFGVFTNVSEIRSASYPPVPPLDSWTFYGSSYSSKYLTFVPVEMYSNVPVRPGADPHRAARYRVLQKLTPAQRALMKAADKSGGTPFTDFAGQAVLIGSPVPEVSALEHLTWSQLTGALRARRGLAAQEIIGAADYLTAEFCTLTGNRPASACPPSIRGVGDF